MRCRSDTRHVLIETSRRYCAQGGVPAKAPATSRLATRQSAQAERLTYQRRGGPRQPGTRSGVFHQKISNSERILLALLYKRRLCTLDVLADALGDVSRSAVGNVIRESLPLLQHEDRVPPPAPTRYRTAADLLAAGARSDTTS